MNQPQMDIYQNTFSDNISKTDARINQFLNQIMALNERTAKNRYRIYIFIYIGIWILSGVILHPPGNLDFYLFKQLNQYNNLIIDMINHLLAVFLSWDVILILISVYIASFICQQLAAIYLADIFEIKDLSIAELFIGQAAFANKYVGAIHIEDGQVRSNDHKSPTFRIGGPGSVIINLENAAVFEKIDGTSTIAGPTTKGPVVLEGFERLRSVIDLRDQTSNFSIFSRTRDGIPVEIKDVRLIFSVFRDNASRTLTRPYPFKREGLNWIVYNQSKGPWTTTLLGLVRGELVSYISKHNLSEILAAPGLPEVQQHIQHERFLARRIRKNLRHTSRYKNFGIKYTKRKTNGPNYLPIYFLKTRHPNKIRFPHQYLETKLNIPFFSTRNQLSKVFYDEFNSTFKQRARQRGLNLEWINVGTLNTPANLILEQHLDAWKLSVENELRSNIKVLSEVKNQAKSTEVLRILRQLPNQKFYEYQYNQYSKNEIIDRLIQDYAAKLKTAREIYILQKGRVPKQVEIALHHIRKYQLAKIKENGGFFIGEEN